MCPVTGKHTVNMDRLFSFRQADGTVWSLRLCAGNWFEFCGDQWQPVDEGYLQLEWYFQEGHWLILKHPLERWDYTQKCFYRLAFELLPEWDTYLQGESYRRDVVKQWSHYGATVKYQDVGNKTMWMTLRLCHGIRYRLGAYELCEFTKRNEEHASDQLEAMMGLRVLDSNWKAAGDCVDQCCAKTHELWTAHWEFREKDLFERLRLQALVDDVICHRMSSMIIQSRAESRVGCHIFLLELHRKLPIENVMNRIKSYCGLLCRQDSNCGRREPKTDAVNVYRAESERPTNL